MGWRDNRRRSVCKKIMFTPEEWEQTRRIHERWARNIPVYRRWGDFARQTLMHGALMNVSVTLASDPEVFKAEPHYGETYANANDYCARTLSLPMHPYMDAAQQQTVIDAVREAL